MPIRYAGKRDDTEFIVKVTFRNFWCWFLSEVEGSSVGWNRLCVLVHKLPRTYIERDTTQRVCVCVDVRVHFKWAEPGASGVFEPRLFFARPATLHLCKLACGKRIAGTLVLHHHAHSKHKRKKHTEDTQYRIVEKVELPVLADIAGRISEPVQQLATIRSAVGRDVKWVVGEAANCVLHFMYSRDQVHCKRH